MVKKYMDETQTRDEARWFELEDTEDGDFPSGDLWERKCSTRSAFFSTGSGVARCRSRRIEGMHKWAIKPFFCVLYPSRSRARW